MSNLNQRNIQFSDSGSIDAFARARFSEPYTIFDSKQLHSKNPLYWAEKITGTATSVHDPNKAATEMSVVASGDEVIRQTRQYFNYQPGKSQLFLGTFVFDTQDANVEQEVGYFDGYNGLFLKDDGTDYKLVVRSNFTGTPADTEVAQSSWNLDAMDGYGPSGVELDFTKSQILVIDFEWLGAGRVRFGFVINGIPIYVHENNNANINPGVYMSSPNLPIRYAIRATGTPGATRTMQHICSALFSEGGFNPVGLLFTADRLPTAQSISTTIEPLVSIRKKSDMIYRGTSIVIEDISILATSGANLWWGLYVNPTVSDIGSASWVSVDDESSVEYDLTMAGTVSGGTLIRSGYISNNQDAISTSLDTLIGLGFDLDDNADIFVLAARNLAGASEDVHGTINWRELG